MFFLSPLIVYLPFPYTVCNSLSFKALTQHKNNFRCLLIKEINGTNRTIGLVPNYANEVMEAD